MTATKLLPPLLVALAAVSCRGDRGRDPVILELDQGVVRRSDFERHVAEVEARGGAPLAPEVRRGLLETFLQLPAELETVAFALAPGGTSEIVTTSLGYHILRVEARQEARASSLPEVQGRIRTLLTREKSDRNVRQFVDDLLARAKVNHAAATRPSS